MTITTCLKYYTDFHLVIREGQKLKWCVLLATFVKQVDRAELRSVLNARLLIDPMEFPFVYYRFYIVI